MMKGIFDGYYQIDIVGIIPGDEKDVICYRITYSRLDYPNFYNYIRNKIFEGTSIIFETGKMKGCFSIISISIAKANEQSEHLNNKSIPLRKEIFGNIIDHVPEKYKKGFLINQYYGIIKMRRR